MRSICSWCVSAGCSTLSSFYKTCSIGFQFNRSLWSGPSLCPALLTSRLAPWWTGTHLHKSPSMHVRSSSPAFYFDLPIHLNQRRGLFQPHSCSLWPLPVSLPLTRTVVFAYLPSPLPAGNFAFLTISIMPFFPASASIDGHW